MRCFFSFYNISFYTHPAFAFHLLVEFCIIRGRIVAFLLFLLWKDFIYILHKISILVKISQIILKIVFKRFFKKYNRLLIENKDSCNALMPSEDPKILEFHQF